LQGAYAGRSARHAFRYTEKIGHSPNDLRSGGAAGRTFEIRAAQASAFNNYTASGAMNNPLQRKEFPASDRAAISSPPLEDVLSLVGDAVSWSKRLASRAAATSAATVRAPEGWASFVALPRAVRRERLRALHRALASAYPTRQFVWDDAADLDPALERLAQLSARARTRLWATRVPSLLPRAWFRMYCVEVAGELAAMALCYAAQKRVLVLQVAADPAYENWHLEQLLLGFAHEHALGQGDDVAGFLPT
jgi:hypothetical protein